MNPHATVLASAQATATNILNNCPFAAYAAIVAEQIDITTAPLDGWELDDERWREAHAVFSKWWDADRARHLARYQDREQAVENAQPLKVLKPDLAAMTAHIYELCDPAFAGAHPNAVLEIGYGHPKINGGDINQAQTCSALSDQDLPLAAQVAARKNIEGYNTYIGAALRSYGDRAIPPDRRATVENYLASRFAWVDFDKSGDAERIEAVLKQHSLVPRLIVTTGTIPHRRGQLYFLVTGIRDAAHLREVNSALQRLLGSDPAVVVAHQVLRLAGSISHPTPKKVDRGYVAELTTLRKIDSAPTYSADHLIGLAGPASEAPIATEQSATYDRRSASGDPFQEYADEIEFKADPDLIADALEHVPNHDLEWLDWKSVLMAAWRATNGSETAFAAIDKWSSKSTKYDAKETRRQWDKISRSPPTATGAEKIFKMARDNGWTRPGAGRSDAWSEEVGAGDDIDVAAGRAGGPTSSTSIGAADAAPSADAGQPRSDSGASTKQDKTGNAALAELNAKYFVAKEGGKIWVITFEKERDRLVASYMRFSDFSNLYMNRKVQITDKDGNTKFFELGKWWLKNRHRRQYDGVVFEPGNPETVIDNRFNLWRGWGVVPQRGNWKRVRQHIWKVLASGDKERFKYIMSWLAWTVQHPDQRAEVALVFKGKRGTGKGTLGNCMMVLFGQHSHQVSNSKHLTGNFNGHMRDVCFLFGDECYWPGEKQAEGTIKRMITEPTLFVEGKGRDGITVPNFLHVMLASNEDWVVPAGENERRYFMADVSEAKMQNHSWFKAIDEQLKSGGYEAMLFDLMHYKLGDWHPRQVPASNGLLEQQARSLSPLDSWWVELLEIGTLTGANPLGSPDCAVANKFPFILATSQGTQSNSPFDVILTKREVIRPGLYDQARSIEPRLRNYANDHVLGNYLKERGCSNVKKVMRRQGWTFPALSECRKAWEQRFPGWKWRDPHLTAWRKEEQDDECDPNDPDRPIGADETSLRQASS